MSRQKTTPPAEAGLHLEVDFLDPLRNFGSPSQAKRKTGSKPHPDQANEAAMTSEVAVKSGSGPAGGSGQGMTEKPLQRYLRPFFAVYCPI